MSAIDCIITAAGLSSRMGQWKMMLPWQQGTILDTSIKNALQFCSRIILVTGYRGNELHERYANQSNITIIHNPDYAQGLLTSVKAAVPAVQTEHCFSPTVTCQPSPSIFLEKSGRYEMMAQYCHSIMASPAIRF